MEYSFGKIQKLADSLEANKIKKTIINKIMINGNTIKQTDKNEKKAKWFYNAMIVMDNELDDETRKKVRQDCACCLGGKRHELCVRINKNYETTEKRIEVANQTKLVFGNGVRILSKGKYEVSFFPEKMESKMCPCLKGLDETMTITYCYCCGGHVKYHLETVLGKKLSVKVLETVLSTNGRKGCRFELKELKNV
jgi:hypothetical protein